MRKLIYILLLFILFDCSIEKEITDCFFVTDYLMLKSEEETNVALDLFFQVGLELEYDYAIYDDKEYYTIEVQDLEVLDYEIDGKRVFPEWYKEKILRFCIE